MDCCIPQLEIKGPASQAPVGLAPANTGFMGPAVPGSPPAAPTFRLLVPADIPSNAIAIGDVDGTVLPTGAYTAYLCSPVANRVLFLPAASDLRFPVGASIAVVKVTNTATLTIGPVGLDLINGFGGFQLRSQAASCIVTKVSTTAWRVVSAVADGRITDSGQFRDSYNNILPPTVNDDSLDGYSEGSFWYDTFSDHVYVCLDPTNGAALWRRLDYPFSNFAATVAPTVNEDLADGYNFGSIWVNTVAATAYICVSPAAGAAVWTQIGGSQAVGFSTCCYVDPAGNDASGLRGNLGKPFLTINAALAASVAGDTICLAPGNYIGDVNWLERRSLLGSGDIVSPTGAAPFGPTSITGTLTLTAGVTNVNNTLDFANVAISGAVAFDFSAKNGGSSWINFRNCFFAAGLALAPRVTTDRIQFFNTYIQSNTTTSFGDVFAVGSRFNAYRPTIPSGGNHKMHGCWAEVIVASGGDGILGLFGCQVIGNTLQVNCDELTTTGCDFIGSLIIIQGTTIWRESGCTFTQADVSGASGNKRASFQRIGSTVITAATTTTVGLPLALGATTYFVAATQITNNSVALIPVVINNKTNTSFDVISAMASNENFEFGVYFR